MKRLSMFALALALPASACVIGTVRIEDEDTFDDGVFDESLFEDSVEDNSEDGDGSSISAELYHCGALRDDALRFCRRFEDQDRRMGDRTKGKKASLAWGESRILRSYVEMFRATDDLHWADKLIDHVDSVLSLQDVANGDTDSLGRSRYGWSAMHGGEGPYRYVAHSGMLTYPIAQFVQMVRDSRLNGIAAYRNKAAEYLDVVERTVAAHNGRFRAVSSSRVSIRPDEGYYFWSCNDAVPAASRCWNNPHNQQLAMGSTLLILHNLTGKAEYLDKAKRLGRVFWRDLEPRGRGYAWHYWWGESMNKCGGCTKFEDTGHGSIDIEFIAQAYRQGFNIGNSNNPFPTRSHMLRFARTFTDTIYVSPTDYRDRVDGSTTKSDNGQPRGAGGWVELAEFDERVYTRARASFDSSANNFKSSNDRLVHLGYARLTRYAAKLGR